MDTSEGRFFLLKKKNGTIGKGMNRGRRYGVVHIKELCTERRISCFHFCHGHPL